MGLRYLVLIGILAIALADRDANAQDLGQCSTMRDNASRSCQSLPRDEQANCFEKLNEAVSRCIRAAKNYNGIGPSGQPRGNVVQ